MRAVVPPAPIPLSANQGTQYSLEGEDEEIEDEDGEGAGPKAAVRDWVSGLLPSYSPSYK